MKKVSISLLFVLALPPAAAASEDAMPTPSARSAPQRAAHVVQKNGRFAGAARALAKMDPAKAEKARAVLTQLTEWAKAFGEKQYTAAKAATQAAWKSCQSKALGQGLAGCLGTHLRQALGQVAASAIADARAKGKQLLGAHEAQISKVAAEYAGRALSWSKAKLKAGIDAIAQRTLEVVDSVSKKYGLPPELARYAKQVVDSGKQLLSSGVEKGADLATKNIGAAVDAGIGFLKRSL
jgi:hypothetical protein